MATVCKQAQESTIGAGYRGWAVLLGRLEHIPTWFVVTAYAVINAVLLVSAVSAVLYVVAILSEVAGTGGAISRIERDDHRKTGPNIDPTCGRIRQLNPSLGQ